MKFHPSVISHLRQWPQPSDEGRAEEELRRWNQLFGQNTENFGAGINYFERLLLQLQLRKPIFVRTNVSDLVIVTSGVSV